MKKGCLLLLIVSLSAQLSAQIDIEKLKAKAAIAADKIESQCIAWRRDFHQNPELGNRETRTSKIIAEH